LTKLSFKPGFKPQLALKVSAYLNLLLPDYQVPVSLVFLWVGGVLINLSRCRCKL